MKVIEYFYQAIQLELKNILIKQFKSLIKFKTKTVQRWFTTVERIRKIFKTPIYKNSYTFIFAISWKYICGCLNWFCLPKSMYERNYITTGITSWNNFHQNNVITSHHSIFHMIRCLHVSESCHQNNHLTFHFIVNVFIVILTII